MPAKKKRTGTRKKAPRVTKKRTTTVKRAPARKTARKKRTLVGSIIAYNFANEHERVWPSKRPTKGTSVRRRDASRHALPPGKRESRSGRIYSERRTNRADTKFKTKRRQKRPRLGWL